MISYYRRFISRFVELAQPLHAATKKSAPMQVEWTPEREETFQLLRECIVNVFNLYIPTCHDSFILDCDASYRGVGAVLNVLRNGQECPIAFFSRQL